MDIPMRPVKTKRDFVRRYQQGEFGNRAPTWDSLSEYRASKYRGLVHLRNRVAGGPTWYNVPWDEVEITWYIATCKVNGGRPAVLEKDLYISGMAPHDRGTIQGEVMLSPIRLGMGPHYELTYCSAKKPMREALAEETRYSTGLRAASLLRTYMDPSSYDWVQYLLETYPNHIVEFSCFSVPWGTIPNRNTVIWEVRAY